MKLKTLEMELQRLGGFVKPRASLEQYQTPAPLAARLLYHALMKGDIEGKVVYDLGSGTGVLAIGAYLLGAKSVIGIEIDREAVRAAEENAVLLDAEVTFITADIRKGLPLEIAAGCDTVVMNPPFGAQKAHADRPFIDGAITIAPVIYGIFNAGSIPFIRAYTDKRATIDEQIGGALPIKRTFSFHTRDIQEIRVEILRLTRTR